jgi:hypothetical protein
VPKVREEPQPVQEVLALRQAQEVQEVQEVR